MRWAWGCVFWALVALVGVRVRMQLPYSKRTILRSEDVIYISLRKVRKVSWVIAVPWTCTSTLPFRPPTLSQAPPQPPFPTKSAYLRATIIVTTIYTIFPLHIESKDTVNDTRGPVYSLTLPRLAHSPHFPPLPSLLVSLTSRFSSSQGYGSRVSEAPPAAPPTSSTFQPPTHSALTRARNVCGEGWAHAVETIPVSALYRDDLLRSRPHDLPGGSSDREDDHGTPRPFRARVQAYSVTHVHLDILNDTPDRYVFISSSASLSLSLSLSLSIYIYIHVHISYVPFGGCFTDVDLCGFGAYPRG